MIILLLYYGRSFSWQGVYLDYSLYVLESKGYVSKPGCYAYCKQGQAAMLTAPSLY